MERFSQALLTCLLNSIWQITLITSVGASGAWLLRDAAARWRHLLWVAILTMCLCLPLMSAYRAWRGPTLDLAEPRSELAAGEVSVELNTNVDRQITPVKESGSVLSIDRNSATGLVALYLLLIGFCAARLFTAWMRARSIAHAASEIAPSEALETILNRCQTALGLKARPKLCAAAIPVPITVGSLKPLIILPDRLLLEDDGDVLTSAIGHELVHIRRRDYAFNLIYELIHLPLSFHPAAALIRRRIRETRELSCDEMVADRLLDADTYARSLVRLAGVAVGVDRRTTITVGLAAADILEERVMKILNRPGTNLLKAKLLLITVSLLLIATCAAASVFALGIDVRWRDWPEAAPLAEAQEPQNNERGAQAAVIMPELDKNTENGAVVAWLKRPGDKVKLGEIIARVDLNKQLVEIPANIEGVIEQLLVPVGVSTSSGSTIAVIRAETGQSGGDQTQEQRNEVRALLEAQAGIEREYQARKQAEIRTLREALAKLEGEHQASKQDEIRALREALVKLEQAHQSTTQDEIRALVEAEARMERAHRSAIQDDAQKAAREVELLQRELTQRAQDRAGQDQLAAELKTRALEVQRAMERARVAEESQNTENAGKLRPGSGPASRQIELARQAKISMRQAIQIATSKHPGKVLESRLTDEMNQVCFAVTILSETGGKTVTLRVLVSAAKGAILKTIRE